MANPVTSIKDDFKGVCYSSTHFDLSGDENPATTLAAYGSDFPLLASNGFQVVRSYAIPGWLWNKDSIQQMDHMFAFIYEAYQNDLRVIFEVPVDPNNKGKAVDGKTEFNTYLIDTILDTFLKNLVTSNFPFADYPVTPAMFSKTVIAVLAGNENIAASGTDDSNVTLQKSIIKKLADYSFTMPVTYCLRCDVMAGDPKMYPNRTAIVKSLATNVPLLITCYPFEWGVEIAKAVTGADNSLEYYYNQITGYHKGVKLALGETGWASYNPPSGTGYALPANYNASFKAHTGPKGANTASVANESTYFKNAWKGYKTIGYTGMLAFEAFDEPVKNDASGGFQRYYGLWTGGKGSGPSSTLKGSTP